jgi:hypothetical protein
MINKSSNILITLMLVIVAGLSSCSSVSTNMDKSVNVNNYKTYAWREPDIKAENPVYKSDLIDKAIRENAERELSQRGLRYNEQNPDLYIVYHTYVENVQRTYGYPYYGYGYPYYGYGGFGGFGYSPTISNTVQGTLVLDFIDSRTNKLVWRGSTQDDVTNVSKIEKTLEKDVHAILKKYPAKGESM